MKDIYSEILNSTRANIPSVLATIIRQRGTSPRGAGAKMLIMKDGPLTGSVGGGALEKAVVEASSKVFSSNFPVRFNSDPGMSCGGDVEVFLEPLAPEDEVCHRIYSEIAEIGRRGGAAVLATATDTRLWCARQAPRALFKLSGEAFGLLPNMEESRKIIMDRMQNLLEGRKTDIIECIDTEGSGFSVFLEPIASDPVLYFFGAGHVSFQAVPLARRVGFRVFVIDDRPEFADPLKFPDAERVLNFPYQDVLKLFPVDRSSFIVIATRSHSCDEIVLAQALRTDAGYVGMLGGRRKISTIFGNLLKEGFTEDDFNRVHSPIGIDIGAETPEEIALSIVSELVKVRAA